MKQNRPHAFGTKSIVLGTLLVNLLLFIGISMLKRTEVPVRTACYDRPVLLSRKPVPPLEEKHRQKTRLKEKPLPKVRRPEASRPRHSAPKPKLNLERPKLDLNMSHSMGPDLSLASFSGTGLDFELGDVDIPPRLIRKLDPVYPYSARRKQIVGRVIVRFCVDTDGNVHSPVIQKATPPGVFDQAVLKSIVKWRFRPGMIDNRPVATWMVQPLEFNLN